MLGSGTARQVAEAGAHHAKHLRVLFAMPRNAHQSRCFWEFVVHTVARGRWELCSVRAGVGMMPGVCFYDRSRSACPARPQAQRKKKPHTH
eukprot:7875889-Pyramimonas_sp.AAC.1